MRLGAAQRRGQKLHLFWWFFLCAKIAGALAFFTKKKNHTCTPQFLRSFGDGESAQLSGRARRRPARPGGCAVLHGSRAGLFAQSRFSQSTLALCSKFFVNVSFLANLLAARTARTAHHQRHRSTRVSSHSRITLTRGCASTRFSSARSRKTPRSWRSASSTIAPRRGARSCSFSSHHSLTAL